MSGGGGLRCISELDQIDQQAADTGEVVAKVCKARKSRQMLLGRLCALR